MWTRYMCFLSIMVNSLKRKNSGNGVVPLWNPTEFNFVHGLRELTFTLFIASYQALSIGFYTVAARFSVVNRRPRQFERRILKNVPGCFGKLEALDLPLSPRYARLQKDFVIVWNIPSRYPASFNVAECS